MKRQLTSPKTPLETKNSRGGEFTREMLHKSLVSRPPTLLFRRIRYRAFDFP